MSAAAHRIDVRRLPPAEISNVSPIFWGQALLCIIEGSVFGVLIATYLYLRMRVDVWPPPQTANPPVVGPTAALAVLLASALGSYWASEAAKKDDRAGMLQGLGLNLLLGGFFLFLRAIEWGQLNFNWAADAHGSIVWTILFVHSFDILADLIYTGVLVAIIFSGRYGEKQRSGVHVDSVVWYFLVAIWIPLYALVYWGPYFLGTR